MKQVITQIETRCDVCGEPFSCSTCDSSENGADKRCHLVYTENMSLTCTLDLSVFCNVRQIKDICPKCRKEILQKVLESEMQLYT